jgi:TolB protein
MDDVDDIWVMYPGGGNPTKLTRGPKIDERPDWSPDGSTLVFSRNGNIWMIGADGTDLTQLTDNRRLEFGPTYSPDGTLIAFNREARHQRFGVWAIATDGSGRERLTNGKYDFFPDWQRT